MADEYPLEELPEAIVMWKEDGLWVIRHEGQDVTTQGESRLHALLMLADALACYTDEETELLELAEDVFEPDDDRPDVDSEFPTED